MPTVPVSSAVRFPFMILVWLCDQEGRMGASHVQAWNRFFSQPSRLQSKILSSSITAIRDGFGGLWSQYVKNGKPVSDQELLLELRKLADDTGGDDAALASRDLLACAKSIAGSRLMSGEAARLHQRCQLLESLLARDPETPAHSIKTASSLDSSPLADSTFWSGGKIRVCCRGVFPETHDVRTFRFVASDGRWFNYRPGQFTTLDLKINGRKIRRSYTISSSPSRPMALDITVKRVPGGLVSNWLHDNLKPGDEITLMGPGGDFTCSGEKKSKLLFLSAGSGITPCMSMARYLFDTAAPVDIVFLHSARTPDDIIFRRECEQMDAARADFRYLVTCTRPAPGQTWAGLVGRLSPSLIEATIPDFRERAAYLCGPEPFMVSTKALLETAGFPMEAFQQESFGGAPKPKKLDQDQPEPAESTSTVASPDTPEISSPTTTTEEDTTMQPETFPITFESSGKTVDCPADEFILDIAEANGIEIPSSCRQGNCGTCKTRKLDGEIECDSDSGLDEADREDGFILTCCSTPRSPLRLEA